MHNKVEILRWVLVIPSAFAGWYTAFIIGLFLYAVADSFCPPDLMVSGSCQASWHGSLVDGLIIFGSCLSAILVLIFAVLVAPSNRILVAKIIYTGGVIFAIYAVYVTSAWPAFFGAVVSGALLLYFLSRYT